MGLFSSLWPFAALSAALGLALGLAAPLRPERRGQVIGAGLALAAFAALAGAALLGIVPGTAGLWVDLGALLFASYAAGCLSGALARRAVRPRASQGAGEA